MDGHDTTVSPQVNELEKGDSVPIHTTKSEEEETSSPDSNFDSDVHKQRVDDGTNTSPTVQSRPNIKQTSSDLRAPRPVTPPKRQPPSKHITGQPHNIRGSDRARGPKPHNTAKRVFDSKTGQTRGATSKPQTGSDVSSSGVIREPLDYVGVTNRTSDGFTLIWDSPEGKYKNFVVTRKQVEKDESTKQKEGKKDQERQKDDSEKEGGNEEEDGKHSKTKEPESENRSTEDENRVPESVVTHIPRKQSSTTVKPATESDKTFKKVIPGSARSFHFGDLLPQNDYTVTLLGKGPGLLSRLHKLVISTGPEPPTNIVFSKVTENSLTVAWTKPKSPVSGFKVTYTHAEDGEPVSVSLDSEDSILDLSKLSPGSSYEVSVISILGLDESDPIKDSVMTLPDPPTDLRAVNVTDTKALLLWRPALAAIDKYAIVYGSGTGKCWVKLSAALLMFFFLPPSSSGTLRFPFPTDCSQELLNGITTSGEVEIFPQGKQGTPLMVYCDMETDGGGWTVFQRRKDGSVDFFRGWKDYAKGFGDLNGEFWLGLNNLHNLTAMTKMSLRVDLRDGAESAYAKYSTFEVAKRNYKLTVGGFNGTAGDSLTYHNDRIFSTKDRDPAPFITRCAMSYRGGWWYKNCHEANLNGLYGIDVKHQGVIWTTWKGKDFSIPFTEMKMRPASFSPRASD
uniref:Tenascin XB n=1 Tax=Lates calcarifer TaxID=8187 RepID=A0A4W6F154_LATCA